MKLNLPNKITVIRILLLPLIVFAYLADFIWFNKILAAALFVVASSTDFLDGYFARKNNEITTLGKFLDPIADKLISISAIILVAIDNVMPAPLVQVIVIVIIGRELIISAFRQVAATKGVVMQADVWGKTKTVAQMVAIPALMLLAQLNDLNITGTLTTVIKVFAYTMFAFSAVLSVISAVNYIVKNKQVIDSE